MSEFALLKRIARNIRYRALDDFIGQEISVDVWDTFHSSLITLVLSKYTQKQIVGILPYNSLTFAKYGLFDITVEMSPAILDENCRNGIHLLNEMGWLDKQGYIEQEEQSPLYNIWLEIKEVKAYIRLYLQAQISEETTLSGLQDMDDSTRRVIQKIMSLGVGGSVKKYPLPNRFKVYDAFITNVPSISMWRNFYT